MNSSEELIDTKFLKLSPNIVRTSIPVFTYKEVALAASYKYGYFEEDGTSVTFSPKTVRVKGDPTKLEATDSIAVTSLDEKSISKDTSYLVISLCLMV